MNRRSFLKLLGLGAAATAAGVIVPEVIAKPERRFWQVPRTGPFKLGKWEVHDTKYVDVYEADCTLFGIDASTDDLWRGTEYSADSLHGIRERFASHAAAHQAWAEDFARRNARAYSAFNAHIAEHIEIALRELPIRHEDTLFVRGQIRTDSAEEFQAKHGLAGVMNIQSTPGGIATT